MISFSPLEYAAGDSPLNPIRDVSWIGPISIHHLTTLRLTITVDFTSTVPEYSVEGQSSPIRSSSRLSTLTEGTDEPSDAPESPVVGMNSNGKSLAATGDRRIVELSRCAEEPARTQRVP